MVNSVFVVDACRTPIGKVKGALAEVRPDHLAADVISALIGRNPWLDVTAIEDVYWGAANQAGEDNRNVARMAVLLAGLPVEIPGATVNRLCGSGMEAVCDAARTIAAGDADVCLAGGSESMTRTKLIDRPSAASLAASDIPSPAKSVSVFTEDDDGTGQDNESNIFASTAPGLVHVISSGRAVGVGLVLTNGRARC